MLYISAAFAGIVLREGVGLMEALLFFELLVPSTSIEIGHVLDFVIISFFAVGSLMY